LTGKVVSEPLAMQSVKAPDDMEEDDLVIVEKELEPQSHENFDITLIAVMGVTGSGKSNFIQLATGSKEAFVGHDLAACNLLILCQVKELIKDRHPN
jgi:ABC-type lipoprotein export system ATPase subunit